MQDSKIKEYNEISKATVEIFDNFKKLWGVFIKEKQNIVCETLLVGLKNQMNMIFENFEKSNTIINSKPKKNDPKGHKFDVVTSDGKIELGLYAKDRDELKKIYSATDVEAGVLREINECGEIVFEDLELIRKYQPFVSRNPEPPNTVTNINEITEETIKKWADKVNKCDEGPNLEKNISSDANMDLWADIINGKKDSFGRDKKDHMKEVVEMSKKFREENKDLIEKLLKNDAAEFTQTNIELKNKELHDAVVKFKEKESKKTKKNKKNSKKK